MSSNPAVAATSTKPKPTSTAPTACANNSSVASLAMVNDPTGSPYPYAFSPKSVTVTCGGVVKVTNNTAYVHTVSPTHGGFADSGDVNATMSASVRFSYPGTYGFYCVYHSNMTGTVTVTK